MATRRSRAANMHPARSARWLLLGLLALGLAAQGEVRRCEDEKGHITYSNEPCPVGTAKERAVEQRPAVEVPHGSGESAQSAGSVKKSPEAAPHATEPGPDLSREQSKAQVARCDDLMHRIEFNQQDLLSATGSERASAELGVRRLQQEYEANCAKH